MLERKREGERERGRERERGEREREGDRKGKEIQRNTIYYLGGL